MGSFKNRTWGGRAQEIILKNIASYIKQTDKHDIIYHLFRTF